MNAPQSTFNIVSFSEQLYWIKNKLKNFIEYSSDYWNKSREEYSQASINKKESWSYYLEKESFLSLYEKENKPGRQLNRKQRRFLKKRLGNLVDNILESKLLERSLVLTTLKFKEFKKLKKVEKIIRNHLQQFKGQFFIFFELDRCPNSKDKYNKNACFCLNKNECVRNWHLHILHDSAIEVKREWRESNNVHQSKVIPKEELEKVLSYVTKSWPSFIFLPLQKYGLKKSDKYFLKIDNSIAEKMVKTPSQDRTEYFKEYSLNNKEKRLLQKQRSKLSKKIKTFSQHKKIGIWTKQLIEVENDLLKIKDNERLMNR